MMNRYIPLLLTIFLASFLSACSEDDVNKPLPVPDQARGLYILNEGTFQRSNASLSIFLPDSNRVLNNVFSAASGRPLGDVGNSLTVHDGKLWIVVNNSHRIEVMDLATRSVVMSIECLEGASPRHIVFSDDGIGYVSNLYRNSVSVLDPVSGSFTAEIPVGSNPDGMAISAGRLYVANSGFGADNTVSIIDLTSNSVVKTLTVGDYPATILPLTDDAIAVLCTGAYNDFNDPADDTPGMLFIIDTQAQRITDTLVIGGHPSRLARDDQGYLYTLNGGVARIHLASKTMIADFIPGFYYGLCVDSKDQRIYVTNPIDYVQAGSVDYYTYAGSKLGSIDVGVLPGSMILHP
jgi:YVTN family beta-propeller protein